MSALASHISRSSGAVQTAGAKAHVRMWLIVLAALLCLGCTLASRMPGLGEQTAYAGYESTEVVHYTVRPGDTLWSIASRFTDAPAAQVVECLKAINGLDDSRIVAGQHLIIPV